jgi:hypothetical protein
LPYRKINASIKVIEGTELITADPKDADVSFIPKKEKH